MRTIKLHPRGGYCSESIIYEGRINSSQDGIVINARGIALTHTAGHGNCPKILIEYE